MRISVIKRMLIALPLICTIGCQPAPPTATTTTTPAKDSHSHEGDHSHDDDHAHAEDHEEHAGHDHDEDAGPAAAGHDHSHDSGPHGGHLVDLQPSGAHAEWTHDDDNHQISVYLDDFDASKVSAVKFIVEIPGADSEEFPLTAGDEAWTLTSETLMTHLNMGDAVAVKLVVVADTGEQSAKMEAHDEHHH